MNYLIGFLVLFTLNIERCELPDDIDLEKIQGIALESPAKPSSENVMEEIAVLGANHICLMPYGYIPSGGSDVKFGTDNWQWWGEKSEGIIQLVKDAQKAGLSILLKPHIWIGWGDYTGDLSFDNEQDQLNWNESYKEYLMHYVQIASTYDIEIICIGTELCMQLNDDPEYWSSIIADIREVYDGSLTYASNWDCYQDFPFWQELDYIGIDAYFPISEEENPSLEDALNGWRYWKSEMQSYTDSVQRPVLFTEYGYRSKEGCLEEPWVSGTGEDGIASSEQQVVAYQALYNSIWPESWFAGGFVWKWHCKEHLKAEKRTKDYTPQGKPAEQIIAKHYQDQSLEKGAE